uniref:Shikimate dehydrogenase n=1 Tax=Philasterides dicentrarchi TaxID=282688 RepID=A0A481XSL0_9CILI|nr:shikimate dehydrogenase [Philasterides dicentrarchi]
MIFSLRSKNEGGFGELKVQTQQEIFKSVAKLRIFDLIDLEFNPSQVSLNVSLMKKVAAKSQIILSKHYIHEISENIVEKQVEKMISHKNSYSILKLCLNENHSDELMLKLKKITKNAKIKLILIKLGAKGALSRVQNNFLTPVCDYYLSKQAVIPGQLEKQKIVSLRRELGLNLSLNCQNTIYLFGSDISLSYSPLIHETAYNLLGRRDLIFKRQQVKTVEDILPFLASNSFLGACITMPFKKTIIPYVDELVGEAAQSMQIVNTVLKFQNRIIGFNTDVMGIVQPLHKKIQKQKIQASKNEHKAEESEKYALILGAGATSGTAVYSVTNYFGMHVLVWNRSEENLKNFVNQWKQHLHNQNITIEGFVNFSQISKFLQSGNIKHLSVIISTVPGNSDLQIDEDLLKLFKPIMFDVSYFPKQTCMHKIAKFHYTGVEEQEQLIVQGFDMLLYQAFEQIKIFTGQLPQKGPIIKLLRNSYFNNLYTI